MLFFNGRTKCKKDSACPEKPFLSKQFFCIVIPILRKGYKEIFTKKGEKVGFFCPLGWLKWGGGQSLGDMIFLRPPLPSYRAELHYHAAGLPGPVLHQYHRQLKISMF